MKYTFLYLLIFQFFSLSLWAQIDITGEKNKVTILPDMAGYNNNTTNLVDPWSNQGRRNTWVESSSPLIRFPGGTVSSYWDHRNERLFGMPNDNEIDISDDNLRPFVQRKHVINWVTTFSRGSNPMTDLKLLYDEMNGETNVMFVLNMITPGADYYEKLWGREINQNPESADWWAMMDDRFANAMAILEKAEANGIPVKYVEFGNEYFFGMGPSGSGHSGGAAVEPYSAGSSSDRSLRGAFPGDGVSYASAVNNWSKKLKVKYPNIRLAATGSDANSDNPSRRNDWNEKVISKLDREVVDAVSFHIYGGVHEGEVNGSGADLAKALKSLEEAWVYDSLRSKMPENIEYWFTEYDASSNKSDDGEGSWGLGLATLFQANNWMKNGNLGLLAFHQFADGGSNGRLTGFGRAYAMYSWASRFCTEAARLTLDGANDIADGIASVHGWKFSNNPQKTEKYLFINYSGSEQTLQIDQIADLVGRNYQIASSNSLGSTSEPTLANGQIDGAVAMPAFSILIAETAPDNVSATIEIQIEGKKINNNSIIEIGNLTLSTQKTIDVSVSNNGQEDLILDDALVNITQDTDNEISLNLDQLTKVIGAGETKTFAITIDPLVEGDKNYGFEILSNSINASTINFILKAFIGDVEYGYDLMVNGSSTSNASTIDLGDFTNESTAIKRSIAIKNTGNEILTIDKRNVILTGDTDFTIGNVPEKINIGMTDYIELLYNPNESGDLATQLDVVFNENEADPVQLSFTAAKTDIEYTYVVEYKYNSTVLENSATIDLGEFDYNGNEKMVSIELASKGNAPIVIDQNQSKIEGALYNIQILPTEIEPGSKKILMVRFRPLSYGDYDAKLTVVSNADENSTMVINLTAQVINKNPQYELLVDDEVVGNTYDFGEYAAAAAVRTFTIHNNGFVDVEIEKVEFTDGDSDDFELNTDQLRSVIAASEETEFDITFTPVAQEAEAEVSIYTNQSSTPKRIKIKGTYDQVTSIDNQLNKIDVYPTVWKSGSTLQFKVPTEKIGVSLLSVIGEEVLNIQGDIKTVQKAVENISYKLPNGLYIIKVQSGVSHIAKRIIKQ
ncbi:choice-of-anchor D domain-containing protein [Flammeovirga pacifica]|uniref:Abnormal spindle-like microcephaly-associated protein ASH domain-containing protein n=1 Tax=Flammeovirga pacifica TaxID=915059 RepID=A0A1S1YSA7_FLAPC|nr:choice-of-anchor D domain-containing protein [Flammeovirga pacifica]OHX63911.1 hypothetical protein NH26_20075 [Flammeovirga pacifica]